MGAPWRTYVPCNSLLWFMSKLLLLLPSWPRAQRAGLMMQSSRWRQTLASASSYRMPSGWRH